MKKNHIRNVNTFVIYIVLIFWAVTTIYPIFWVISNSFKDKKQIMSNAFSLPVGKLFTTANYTDAFSKMNILNAYKNSIIISGCVAAVVILLAGMASFALVRYSFKGSRLLYNIVIAAMMFPVFSTIILTLSLVAEKTYVSQWHLSKLLNKHENRNFSEILNQIRVEHAKELLKEMSLWIVDISEMVGFTDVAHFSRVFKKLEGISANEFRNTKL